MKTQMTYRELDEREMEAIEGGGILAILFGGCGGSTSTPTSTTETESVPNPDAGKRISGNQCESKTSTEIVDCTLPKSNVMMNPDGTGCTSPL